MVQSLPVQPLSMSEIVFPMEALPLWTCKTSEVDAELWVAGIHAYTFDIGFKWHFPLEWGIAIRAGVLGLIVCIALGVGLW